MNLGYSLTAMKSLHGLYLRKRLTCGLCSAVSTHGRREIKLKHSGGTKEFMNHTLRRLASTTGVNFPVYIRLTADKINATHNLSPNASWPLSFVESLPILPLEHRDDIAHGPHLAVSKMPVTFIGRNSSRRYLSFLESIRAQACACDPILAKNETRCRLVQPYRCDGANVVDDRRTHRVDSLHNLPFVSDSRQSWVQMVMI